MSASLRATQPDLAQIFSKCLHGEPTHQLIDDPVKVSNQLLKFSKLDTPIENERWIFTLHHGSPEDSSWSVYGFRNEYPTSLIGCACFPSPPTSLDIVYFIYKLVLRRDVGPRRDVLVVPREIELSNGCFELSSELRNHCREYFKKTYVSANCRVDRCCFECGKPEMPGGDPLMLCPECKAVLFCSAECLTTAAPAHDPECALIRESMNDFDTVNTALQVNSDEEWPCVARTWTLSSYLRRIGLHGVGYWKYECECCYETMLEQLGLEQSRDEGILYNLYDKLVVDESTLSTGLPALPHPALENIPTRDICGWKEFCNWRFTEGNSPALLRLLSSTMTMMYSLTHICPQALRQTPGIVVLHVLGVEKECHQLRFLSELWPMLQSHLPKAHRATTSLRIEMVGPSVPPSLHETSVVVCERFTVTFHKHSYDEWPNRTRPSLIVALNSGFDAFPAWVPTMQLISAEGLPCVFTDHTRIGCSDGCATFAAMGSTVSHKPTVNPFLAPFTIGKPATLMPNYHNGYIASINCCIEEETVVV